jgi:hypothetical protein
MEINQALNQVKIMLEEGNTQEAIILLKDIIKQDTGSVEAWLLMAQLVDEPQQQKDYLKQALSLDPNNKEALNHLLKLNAGRFDGEPQVNGEIDQKTVQHLELPNVFETRTTLRDTEVDTQPIPHLMHEKPSQDQPTLGAKSTKFKFRFNSCLEFGLIVILWILVCAAIFLIISEFFSL